MRQHGDVKASRRRELIGDTVLVGVLLLVGLGTLPFLPVWGDQSRPVDVWAYALVAVVAIAAGFRNAPVVSFTVAVVATSVYLSLGYPYGAILLGLSCAAYTLARRVRLPIAAIAAGVALPVLLAHVFVTDTVAGGVMALLPGSAWIIVPFSVGIARRLAVEYAQKQRADAEQRALDDERMRLASEVHDIVGHGLAAIQMQADIARHIGARKPEQADIALEAISRASADALAELRATLAAIVPDNAVREEDSRAPTPGLDRLPDLSARIRESGVDVDLKVIGQKRKIPPAIDLAAYRIVQESLTNVAKHSPERHAEVSVRYASDALVIDVVSTPTPTQQVQEGFGIAGMRRRAHAVNGWVRIDVTGDEFRVTASLPA